MEELFNTLLYLIPMAFFIFIRLRGEKRKQEAAKRTAAQKTTTGTGAVTPPKGRIVETGKARRPQPAEPGEAEGPRAEDAGAATLLARLFQSGLYPGRTMTRETSPYGPPPFVRKPPEETTRPREEQARPAAREIPPPRDVKEAAVPAGPAGPAAAAVPREKTPRSAGTGIFSAKLEKMPPLRRAVVMAEILGSPRGLKDQDTGFSG